MRTLCALLFLAFNSAGCHPEAKENQPTAAVRESIRRLDGTTLTSEQISNTVERLMSSAKVTGLALAILNDGEVVYLSGFGVRDVEQTTPVTPNSVMSAASFTKAMFAYTVMQLVEEGVIGLDTPVHEYLAKPLPNYPRYADLTRDERWKQFTTRMLLSHTAGLPNWRWFNPSKKLDIKFDPGTKYSYSGEGIDLLQFVVEQITGRPVEDLIRERVFTKFGMHRTGMKWKPEFKSDLAVGHDEQGRPLGHKQWKSASAAGSADTDIAGMAAFLQGVLKGASLSATTREEMLTPQIRIRSLHQFPTPSDEVTDRDDAIKLSYGLGWGLFSSPYGKAFFKEGHDEGWEHYLVAFQDSGTAIVIMTNSSNGESIIEELLSTLLGDTYSPCRWNRYIPYNRSP